ncbi:MAG: hypothetical protein C4334_08850 [Pyrinomonas sp.]|uniref:hypothetical protein n=1 Tax=Pyrinomonas sp. TaxID=2080306 RepID=UPI0033227229
MILKTSSKETFAKPRANLGSEQTIKLEALVASLLLCGLLLFALFSSCANRSIEETVTTDVGRRTAQMVNAPPIVQYPQLPERDPDVETAGDRIAEAIMRLRRRQTANALRALARANAALVRAGRAAGRTDAERDMLNSTLRQIKTAEALINRGVTEQAIKQLSEANRNLDRLNMHQL